MEETASIESGPPLILPKVEKIPTEEPPTTPEENAPINDTISRISDEKIVAKTPVYDDEHIETVFKGTIEDNTSSVMKVADEQDKKDAIVVKPEKKKLVTSLSHPEKKVLRNESDIFSLKTEPTVATSIFSVNGSPSRRVFHRRERTPNNVFPVGAKEEPPSDTPPSPRRLTKENYNDEKRPSSSYRNPLTGSGLSSNDEYKAKGVKRKDGNPLLGLGYTEIANAQSSQRIPPGGPSHKLW